MGLKEWLYFGFTAFLVVALAGVMVYYFRSKRKDRVESPKYEMMDED